MTKTFSDNFNAKWLFESPLATGPAAHNPYEDLVHAVNLNIDAGYAPEKLDRALRKLVTSDDIFYWVERDNNIDIISQMHTTPSGLFIELTGKRPGGTTYASNFYELILKDSKRLIFSGNILSDEGLGIWKQLLKHDKKLFVYNLDSPLDRQSINSEEELMNFIGGADNYKKYRYVLSESIKEHSSVITSFDLLRAYNLTFGIK